MCHELRSVVVLCYLYPVLCPMYIISNGLIKELSFISPSYSGDIILRLSNVATLSPNMPGVWRTDSL